jgi:hypothetical protein
VARATEFASIAVLFYVAMILEIRAKEKQSKQAKPNGFLQRIKFHEYRGKNLRTSHEHNEK